jgi:hypothetical protein
MHKGHSGFLRYSIPSLLVFAIGFLTYIAAQDDWQEAVGVTTERDLLGVAYGNNIYVAVGDTGTILTSSDGENWTSRTSGVTKALRTVVWGNNQFVAGGDDGTILTSANGESWSSKTSGATSSIHQIIWASNKFIVVGGDTAGGDDAILLTSTDGSAWQSRTTGLTAQLDAVVWGNNLFVAVGNEGGLITSADGEIWTKRDPGTDYFIRGIVWTGSKFMGISQEEVGSGDPLKSIVSTNGTDWTAQEIQVDGQTFPDWMYGMIWDGKQCITVGFFGSILVSTDALTWEEKSYFLMYDLKDIVLGPNLLVAVGGGGSIIWSETSSGIKMVRSGAKKGPLQVSVTGQTVRYTVPGAAPVSLSIHDLNGKQVSRMELGIQSPGAHSVAVPKLSQGRYAVTLQSAGYKVTSAMLLVK